MLIPIGDVPRWHAERKAPGAVAARHGADVLTWSALEKGANRRARAFRALGVAPGDVVAVGLPNGNALFETTFAIWKLGATAASLSPKLPRGEAGQILDLLRPSLVAGGGPDWNAPVRVPADFAPEGVADGPVEAPVARHWKALTSGGSTGRPKVIFDHMPAVADTAATELRFTPGEVLLNPGPLYHNAPFSLSHSALFKGGEVVGMARFDAAEALRLIEAYRVTWVNLVPTMMHRIWALPEAERGARDLSSLRTVFHMAAPMPAWLKEQWIGWLGPERIWEYYGGTERQGRTVISGSEWLAHRGSVGRAVDCELRVLDADGRDMPPGEAGEIFFRPPDGAGTTYHYLGAEPRRIAGGWESLGDVGHLDADGYLYLGDRSTDIILRGGANIYPAEVEAALAEHPEVRSSLAFGLPHPDLGAQTHAILELAPSADAAAVVASMPAFLGDRLSRYKHPESFEVVRESPRDEAGKVRRGLLRAERIAWLAEGRDFRILAARLP